MPHDLGQRLQRAVERESAELDAIAEAAASNRPGKDSGWSRKEELGHLLDSAANNHVRFVRGSLEASFAGPTYDQNGWVRLHRYREVPWATLVAFWRQYNGLLAHLISQIPEERLSTQCLIGSSQPVTLGFLIEDYILHMQHHLDHILARENITEYPGAAIGV
jgi:hypothetical protein